MDKQPSHVPSCFQPQVGKFGFQHLLKDSAEDPLVWRRESNSRISFTIFLNEMEFVIKRKSLQTILKDEIWEILSGVTVNKMDSIKIVTIISVGRSSIGDCLAISGTLISAGGNPIFFLNVATSDSPREE